MMLTALGALLPSNVMERWSTLLMYAGVRASPRRTLGALLVLSALCAALFSYDATLLALSWWSGCIVGLVLPGALTYYIVASKAEARAREVEDALPDALALMAANLRSGSTVDRAVLLKGERRLGLLEEALTSVGQEVSAGGELKKALAVMASHFDSSILRSTIGLITTGLRGGGRMAILLEQLSRTLRQQDTLQKKTRSTVISYVMLVGTSLSLIAPFLFAVSVFLVVTIQADTAGAAAFEEGAEVAFFAGSASVTEPFLIKFSMAMLIASGFCGALLIGQLLQGRALWGLRYAPVLSLVAVGVFFGAYSIIRTVLAGVLQ